MKNTKSPNIAVSTIVSEKKGLMDPLQLIEGRKKNHGKEDLLLLESADVVTKLGEKSLALFDMALKVQCLGSLVRVSLIHPEALGLIKQLETIFSDQIVRKTAESLELQFEPLHSEADMEKKMLMSSPLDVLRVIMQRLSPKKEYFSELMVAGVFSYDFIDHFEKLSPPKKDILEFPNYIFWLPLSVVKIDHPQNRTTIYCHGLMDEVAQDQKQLHKRAHELSQLVDKYISKQSAGFHGALENNKKVVFNSDKSDDDFVHLVDDIKEHIYRGDVYQIVPSRTFVRPLTKVYEAYDCLRKLNPSPYMFFVEEGDFQLFGSSPETFIQVSNQGKKVAVRPIAGTRRRGVNERGEMDHELDSRREASLCLDEKELAEHMMLVDLARNDVASVAKPKSRRVTELLRVDRFSHVMHLVSEITGDLRDDLDAFHAFQVSMNMGTLMGAPKVRAAEILRQFEETKRGPYGGAVGYFNKNGDMDTAITIRSALVKNGQAYVRAGCGVVFDSDAQFECEETKNKAEAVLKAMAVAEPR